MSRELLDRLLSLADEGRKTAEEIHYRACRSLNQAMTEGRDVTKEERDLQMAEEAEQRASQRYLEAQLMREKWEKHELLRDAATALRRQDGASGGRATAAITAEVRRHAETLAKERAPAGGWPSAPQAAEAILPDLRAFARERGRNPSARKVAEWLREAGIKKGGRT